jgi:hypothetical protein
VLYAPNPDEHLVHVPLVPLAFVGDVAGGPQSSGRISRPYVALATAVDLGPALEDLPFMFL